MQDKNMKITILLLLMLVIILCSFASAGTLYWEQSADFGGVTNGQDYHPAFVPTAGWDTIDGTEFYELTSSANEGARDTMTAMALTKNQTVNMSFTLNQLHDRWIHICLYDATINGFCFQRYTFSGTCEDIMVKSEGDDITDCSGDLADTTVAGTDGNIEYQVIFNATHFKVIRSGAQLFGWTSLGTTITAFDRIDWSGQFYDPGKVVEIKNFKIENATDPISTGPTNFTITAVREYNGTSLHFLNATVNGTYNSSAYTSSSGTISTVLLTNNLYLHNITVGSNESGGFFSRTYYQVNISTPLEAELWQYEYNVMALDATSNASIDSFSVETQQGVYSTSNGSLTLYLNAANYTFNMTSGGYAKQQFQVNGTPFGIENTTLILIPYLSFSILKETDNTPFHTNTTNSTTLYIYCPSTTLEYNFNITSGSNSINTTVSCAWELMKLNFVYDETSYFRTLIPEHDDRNITFYALDLTEDLAYQIILNLNDLTGEFSNGIAILKKYIAGVDRYIIQQQFDVENKVVLYLLKDGLYTLSIRSNAGTERSLGYFIADAAEEKTINIPDIEFVPEVTIGGEISWSWDDGNGTLIRLMYEDTTAEKTNWLNFTIYNGSALTTVIYTTYTEDLSSGTFSYILAGNYSYLACFKADHNTISNIGECKVYSHQPGMGTWTGWEAEEKSNITNWFSIFFLLVLILLFSSHVGVGMSLATIFMWTFMEWGWLTFGSVSRNYIILSLCGVVAAIMLFSEESK